MHSALPIILLALTLLSITSCRDKEAAQNTVEDANRSAPTPMRSGAQPCVNLNTASVEELATLTGIGEVIARRIIAYRESHGRFRRPEEIIIIEGISDGKYREIADRLCV